MSKPFTPGWAAVVNNRICGCVADGRMPPEDLLSDALAYVRVHDKLVAALRRCVEAIESDTYDPAIVDTQSFRIALGFIRARAEIDTARAILEKVGEK